MKHFISTNKRWAAYLKITIGRSFSSREVGGLSECPLPEYLRKLNSKSFKNIFPMRIKNWFIGELDYHQYLYCKIRNGFHSPISLFVRMFLETGWGRVPPDILTTPIIKKCLLRLISTES